jgi:hypothetical protein
MNINDIKRFTQHSCTVCGKESPAAIKLPSYPITELYEDQDKTFSNSGFFDQELAYCPNCDHAHLRSILDVDFIYENYLTHSSGSWGAEKCLISFLAFIKQHLDLEDYSTLIDIGGNDSYFLNMVETAGIQKVNIDPNASGESPIIVEKCGIENLDLSRFAKQRKVIVSSHTIEHLADPTKMVEAIAEVMDEQDVCFLQFPSLELMVNDLRFDQICHQHLNLFSATSINKLLNRYGLHVTSLEYDADHFGTLRICAKKDQGQTRRFERCSIELIQKKYDLYRNYMDALNNTLDGRKDRICGFGAGLMVPTLSYALNNIHSLECIFDDDPNKIGKRFINVDVEIRPSSEMKPDDIILITSISTKMTLRRIVALLSERDVHNIIIPNLSF